MGSVLESNCHVRQLHDDVYKELHGFVFSDRNWTGGKDFARKATSEVEVASRTNIKRFLDSSPLYNSSEKRWRYLPRVEDDADTLRLHQPLCEIITAIIGRFGDPRTRTVCSTWLEPLDVPVREEDFTTANNASDKSFPGIAIMGLGNSFPPSEHALKDGGASRLFYPDCVSPFLVKNSRDRRYAEDIVQMGVYAKQCFEQQHNRHFVYTLHLTNDSFITCMFDRNGVHHSGVYDINAQADTFVHAILGVSSADDALVGFDTSIFWDANTPHRFLKTVDAKGRWVCYQLEYTNPIFIKSAIEGPGTCCWLVRDADGNRLVVKDSWHSSTNWSEGYFLKRAKGLVGVGQMVAYEKGPCISSLRNISPNAVPKNTRNTFRDRTFFRVIFEDAGRPIYQFNTPQEVLYAMRDAIAGHQRLWDAGILHRDISARNILIGPLGSAIGNRGVVIDLDMSTELIHNKSLRRPDWRLGTHAYNSIDVLQSSIQPEQNTCHDYLDDMESFFYVLAWLILERPRVKPYQTFMEIAEIEPASKACLVKEEALFMRGECAELNNVSPYFGPVFAQLLRNFRYFLLPLHCEKVCGTAPYSRDSIPTYGELKPFAAEHYATLLRIFGDAIEEYELAVKAKAKAAVAAAAASAVVAAATRRTLKRPADMDDLEECPPQKTQKFENVPKGSVPGDTESLDEHPPRRILELEHAADDGGPSNTSLKKCPSQRVPKLDHETEDSAPAGTHTSLEECPAQRVRKHRKHSAKDATL